MTEVFSDNVDTTLLIDGEEWLPVEAVVELSRMETPNYVDIIMVPDSSTIDNLPSSIDNLIGSTFRLEADNQLISDRDSNAEEDSLLFEGNLANISATGRSSYEAIAYDPGQQPFAPEEDGGSIMNEFIEISPPEYDYLSQFSPDAGTNFTTNVIPARELVQRATDKLGLTDVEIELEDGGVERSGEEGSVQKGFDRLIYFNKSKVTIKNALDKARKFTESEWWFDKSGTFHFGPPQPTKHILKFIIEASDGKTTPPYQSVRVIGSGAASQEGFSRTAMSIEESDKIVKEAEIAVEEESGNLVPNTTFDPPLSEPVFEYTNLEISNDEQALSTVKSIINDLAEQQSGGKVTVVGFPEIVPMDGIVMPQANNESAENFDANKPMGGHAYSVYKVTHRLNNSEGFITQIEVAGVSGVTRTVVNNKGSGVGVRRTGPPGSESDEQAGVDIHGGPGL